MTNERAFLAFKLKEPVTVNLPTQGFSFEGYITGVNIEFKTARSLRNEIDGKDRELSYSFIVKPNDSYTPFDVSADRMTTNIPEPPEEYKEIIIRSLVGL